MRPVFGVEGVPPEGLNDGARRERRRKNAQAQCFLSADRHGVMNHRDPIGSLEKRRHRSKGPDSHLYPRIDS